MSSSSLLRDPFQGELGLVYQAILTNGIMPKFRQRAILMKNLLNNDEKTLLLIRYCTSTWQDGSTLQDATPLVALDPLQTHLLFKIIAHKLLDTVVTVTETQNSTSSFGTISLEELLIQRLKRLL